MEIELAARGIGFVGGVVVARGVRVAETPPALADEVRALVAARAAADFPPAEVKDAVRALLRAGGYKPSGRGKPASEYLAQAAREGRFPSINNLVDANNLLSLESGLPVSLLDLAAFDGRAVVRHGGDGESYVFNAAGQVLDLRGLLCVCRGDGAPLGTPVKDSMAGKLKPETVDVLGVIYGARAIAPPARMAELAARFAALLGAHAGAASVETQVVAG